MYHYEVINIKNFLLHRCAARCARAPWSRAARHPGRLHRNARPGLTSSRGRGIITEHLQLSS